MLKIFELIGRYFILMGKVFSRPETTLGTDYSPRMRRADIEVPNLPDRKSVV